MPPRIKSPFNPGKAAVIEPIVQPLYSTVTFATTPEQKRVFFSQQIGTGVITELQTNLDTQNQLPNPKIFVILGLRLHPSQSEPAATPVLTQAVQSVDVLRIIYNYWFLLFIGSKDYLKVPSFYLSSGLGLYAHVDETAAAAVSTLGWPTFHSHWKNDRHPITIPPQQNFKCELNQGAAPGTLSAVRTFWLFMEGDFGREVQ